MRLIAESELIFLKADSGIFVNDNGEKIEWYNLVVADPNTYENHNLAYKPSLDTSLKALSKGQKILFSFDLEPTKKKSRVLVVDFTTN